MGFPDVYFDKLDLLLIGLVEFVETHGPVYVRWSRKASKDQDNRLYALKAAQYNGIFTVDISQLKIRGLVTEFWCLGVVFFLPGGCFVAVLDCAHIDYLLNVGKILAEASFAKSLNFHSVSQIPKINIFKTTAETITSCSFLNGDRILCKLVSC